jgi:hypothetical protein
MRSGMSRPVAQIFRLLLMVACALCCASSLAIAQTRTVGIGDLWIEYDTSRWQPEPGGFDELAMHPIGAAAGKLDPVHLSRFPGSGRQDCERLAPAQLSGSLYEEPMGDVTTVAGVTSLRLEAHTRCRNAMPKGVVICTVYRGSAYVLTASRPGCHSGGHNLFSGTDPLQELVGGITFAR